MRMLVILDVEPPPVLTSVASLGEVCGSVYGAPHGMDCGAPMARYVVQ